MWKVLKNIIAGVKAVKKYGSLFVVILDILGYSGDKLEVWQKENEPILGKTSEK